ncbi:MAG: hypothetical protein AABX37_03475 [Nanoarchaeota archaeon]
MTNTPIILEAKTRLFTGAPFTVYGVCSRFIEKVSALRQVLDGYRYQLAEEYPSAASGFRLIAGSMEIYFPDGRGNEECVENLIEALLVSKGRSLFCGPDVSEMRQDFRTINSLIEGTLRAGVDYQGEGYCLEARAELHPPFVLDPVTYRRLQRAISIFPPKEQSVAEALALQP